jgi:hypothetical protein
MSLIVSHRIFGGAFERMGPKKVGGKKQSLKNVIKKEPTCEEEAEDPSPSPRKSRRREKDLPKPRYR